MATPEAQREYQRQWVARRRAEWFADKVCLRCGSIDGLELDHIDWRTKVSHSIWSWSAARRAKELKKCQVLCHDCHLQKSIGDMPDRGIQVYQHGTYSTYRRGCKCEPCMTSSREQRARHRSRT
jgi:hypothetical protein